METEHPAGRAATEGLRAGGAGTDRFERLMARRLAAPCGACCSGCPPFLEGLCCGCGYELGETCRGECAVYRCAVVERGLEHCGLCPDLPCHLFLAQAAPLTVARRYRAVVRRAEVGTEAWLAEHRRCGDRADT